MVLFKIVQKHFAIFWLYTIYGGIKLLRSFFKKLATSPRTPCKILAFKRMEDFGKKSFVDVDDFFYVYK